MYDTNERWSDWSACEWYGHDFDSLRIIARGATR